MDNIQTNDQIDTPASQDANGHNGDAADASSVMAQGADASTPGETQDNAQADAAPTVDASSEATAAGSLSDSEPAADGTDATMASASGQDAAAGTGEPIVSDASEAVASQSAMPAPVEAAPEQSNGQSEAPSAEPAVAPRPSRQPSMAQVMESDEFSSYMSGVDALQRGALMSGRVVRVDENTNEVLVDIGTKSEGIISRSEMGDDEVNVGDDIEVVVLRPEDDDGHPVLSKRRADYEKTWRLIQAAKEKQTNIEGTVTKEVKGGIIVNLGVEAFVPASHIDARNRSDLSRFVGRTIPLRVIEIDRKKNKVIGSHRLAVEEDRQKREEDAWETLQKDKIVEGIVRRITDFGAFVDVGGIDGLLHVREMAWNRVEHPDDVVKKGQKLQVLILEVDRERKRIALGLKQLQSDPWKKAAKNYTPGQIVTGKIIRIAPSCAFMELEEGVEGIIPISEMSEERIKTPEDVLAVGQEVEARVRQVQTNQRRITLSLRSAVQERERRETRTAVREVNTRAISSDEPVRLGDVFGQQLRAARDRGKERNEARALVDRKAARARAEEAADQEEDDFDVDLTDDVVDVADDTEVSEVSDVAGEANVADDVVNIADDNVAGESENAGEADVAGDVVNVADDAVADDTTTEAAPVAQLDETQNDAGAEQQ